jgi:hypothetical protein
MDWQMKCIAQAEEESFKAFGRQRHQQETQANQTRAKAAEAAMVRLSSKTCTRRHCKALSASTDGDTTTFNYPGGLKIAQINRLHTDLTFKKVIIRPPFVSKNFGLGNES